MRPWLVLQSSLFAAGVVGLAAFAATRATSFHFPDGSDFITGKLARAFESHYDTVFPAKTLGTNVWAAADYLLFGEGRPGVIVGEQGWLYTAEEFQTYADADAQVAAHLALVPRVREQLAARDAALVVALVPSKARVYPEYVGDRRPAHLRDGLYAQAAAAWRAEGIAMPDLDAAMHACKAGAPATPMFLRTDTHWTPAGSQCAAESIAAVARAKDLLPEPPTPYRTHVEAARVHQGDLMKFLPLDPYFARLLPEPDRLEARRTEADRAADDPAAGLFAEAADPDVVVVGTSYSADTRWNFIGALQQALGADVASYAAQGKGPFVPMLEYLDSADFAARAPALVIWEIPERYLPIGEGPDAVAAADDRHAAPESQPAPNAGSGTTSTQGVP